MLAQPEGRRTPPSTASSRKSSRSHADSDRTLLHLHNAPLGGKLLEEGIHILEDHEKPTSPSETHQSHDKVLSLVAHLAASTVFQLVLVGLARRSAWPTTITSLSAEAIFGGLGSLVWKRLRRSDLNATGASLRKRDILIAASVFLLATLANLLQAGSIIPIKWALVQVGGRSIQLTHAANPTSSPALHIGHPGTIAFNNLSKPHQHSNRSCSIFLPRVMRRCSIVCLHWASRSFRSALATCRLGSGEIGCDAVVLCKATAESLAKPYGFVFGKQVPFPV